MNNIQTINVYAREINSNGRMFVTCTANINNRWYKVKFKRGVANNPTVRGLYKMTIDVDDCSIEKGSKYTDKNGKTAVGNPTIWVGAIKSIEQYGDDYFKEKNREKFAEIFGNENFEEIGNSEELPF